MEAPHYRLRIDPPRYRPDGHGLARERDEEVARIGLGSEPSLDRGALPLSRSGQTMHVSDNASLPSESFRAIRRHTRPPRRYPRRLAAARRCDRPDAKVRAQAPLQFGIVNTPNLTREYFFSASLPDDPVAAYESRLGDESYRVFLGMLV